MPAGTRYRWLAETEEVERAVFHLACVPRELEQAAKPRGYFCRQLANDELNEEESSVRRVAVAL